jgi:hypothetical protein
MRRSLLVVAAIAALAFLPATSAAPVSGVYGFATLLNSRPVCVEGQPCERPASGLVLRFSLEGRVVGRTATDRAGYYAVRLPRGVYAVSIAPGFQRRGITPRTVRVLPGKRARVDFEIDMRLQ